MSEYCAVKMRGFYANLLVPIIMILTKSPKAKAQFLNTAAATDGRTDEHFPGRGSGTAAARATRTARAARTAYWNRLILIGGGTEGGMKGGRMVFCNKNVVYNLDTKRCYYSGEATDNLSPELKFSHSDFASINVGNMYRAFLPCRLLFLGDICNIRSVSYAHCTSAMAQKSAK